MKFLKKNEVDLILLDINLENSSGFDLYKKIKIMMNTPILFISTSASDVFIALNIEGDDYIQKTYSFNVLLAKAKVVLKRVNNICKSDSYKDEELMIDFTSEKV